MHRLAARGRLPGLDRPRNRAVSRRAARAGSVAEMRDLARRRLPRPIFDLVEGGAEDEVTVHRNSSAFLRARLLPRAFADVAT